MAVTLRRRELLASAGAAVLVGALPGCGIGGREALRAQTAPAMLQFPRLRATPDRITRITVCTRPFRAAGPRVELERVGGKSIVHNYGHGGSGWSLSWGSSTIAVRLALATGEREFGVIGCGALGMTSALLLLRAGARVTIYARELPPNVRSSLATGVWTPDSRICLEQQATPAFKQTWEEMARGSFLAYQNLLGLPGSPVEYIDTYAVFDAPNPEKLRGTPVEERPKFAELQRELIGDLMTAGQDFPPGTHPFAHRNLRRNSLMMFNLTAYSRLLLSDFTGNGGRIEIAEFHSAAELAVLPQRTLVNATGYGSRALFDDQSLTPVRGQLARLIPQAEINYGLFYRNVAFVPRRDGLVFQALGESDYYGFDDPTTTPDRAEAEHAVNTIGQLFPA